MLDFEGFKKHFKNICVGKRNCNIDLTPQHLYNKSKLHKNTLKNCVGEDVYFYLTTGCKLSEESINKNQYIACTVALLFFLGVTWFYESISF